MALRFFDMFAGIGGFRSGLTKLDGFECVGFCEIDPYAKKAYETLYDTKGELYFADARAIDPEEFPDLDLICGGFPCQSFSVAGRRLGFEDTRGTLFFEIARIAAVKRPKYLLLENVPGLLSHDKGRTFAAILGALDELGYDVAWQVLNSANFGVPQSRNRVFIVGCDREKCAGKVLSFTDCNPKTLKQLIPGPEGSRVYGADGLSVTLTSQAGGFAGMTGMYFTDVFLPVKVKTKSGCQKAYPGDSVDIAYPDINSRRGRVGHDIAHTLTTSATQGYFGVDMNPDPKITELARCLTAHQDAGIGTHNGEHTAIGMMLPIEDAPRSVINPGRETIRQQGRRIKEPDEPMYTLTAMDIHGIVYNGYIRKLMPLECFRLQGFTDEQFQKLVDAGFSDAKLYKFAGNAVSVPVITALGRFILSIESEANENAELCDKHC